MTAKVKKIEALIKDLLKTEKHYHELIKALIILTDQQDSPIDTPRFRATAESRVRMDPRRKIIVKDKSFIPWRVVTSK